MRPIITTLFMMRIMVAAVVLVVVVGINFTWIFTVPACITSGGAPGSSAAANQDKKGMFGCWLKPAATEQARQQAFDEWARDSERADQENRARLDRERREHRW